MHLLRHELCRIYALFWSDFDADFYADIEDFVQILCRFLHEKMLGGTSVARLEKETDRNLNIYIPSPVETLHLSGRLVLMLVMISNHVILAFLKKFKDQNM